MLYEVYLDVALRFAKKGDFKQADKTLQTLRKVLRCARKATLLNKPAKSPDTRHCETAKADEAIQKPAQI